MATGSTLGSLANAEKSSTRRRNPVISSRKISLAVSSNWRYAGIVAAVLAGQLLHGQLNRGERVLDLVGQAPRDFLPGRHLLQVFEARTRLAKLGHHAVKGAAKLGQLVLALGRHAHLQIAGAHAAGGIVQARHPARDLAGEEPADERRRGQHHQHHHDVLAQKARNDEVVHAVELLLLVDGVAQGQKFSYMSSGIPKVSSSTRAPSSLFFAGTATTMGGASREWAKMAGSVSQLSISSSPSSKRARSRPSVTARLAMSVTGPRR
jgi:hypothetical protein